MIEGKETGAFMAEVRKRGKTKFWVEIPDEVKNSLDLKEGQFVEVTLKRVEKKKAEADCFGGVHRPAPIEGQKEKRERSKEKGE